MISYKTIKLNQDDIVEIDCNHQYHNKCITEWIILKRLCPLCDKCL